MHSISTSAPLGISFTATQLRAGREVKYFSYTALKAADALTLKDRVFDSLSDGEKQKVMTARALAQETPLLLLDEPTSFLDYESKRSFFRLLADCARQRGKIVIVSSHDLIYAAEENPRWIFCGGEGGEIEEKTPAFRSALFSDKN